jgi:pre-mRNA-processing factor SLU7
VRNREDYAKYLLNLDVNSDYFDPKSRSMKNSNPSAVLDNLEVIGERDELISQDKFAAEQVELHNSELSTIALPTLTEKIYKKIKESNQSVSSLNKTKEIVKRYGDIRREKPLDIVEEDEEFVTYGRLSKKTTGSRYEEDVFINDHLSVWGSWYNKLLGWGYECCYATEKDSYCLGKKGKEKALAAELKLKAQQLRELHQLEEDNKAVEEQTVQKELQENKVKAEEGGEVIK